jgi:hypothetical protein
MNIAAEKEDLIRRFNLIQDIELIKAIKSFLDLSTRNNKPTSDESPLKSVNKAISDSDRGFVRPYNEFMAETRKRFGA